MQWNLMRIRAAETVKYNRSWLHVAIERRHLVRMYDRAEVYYACK